MDTLYIDIRKTAGNTLLQSGSNNTTTIPSVVYSVKENIPIVFVRDGSIFTDWVNNPTYSYQVTIGTNTPTVFCQSTTFTTSASYGITIPLNITGSSLDAALSNKDNLSCNFQLDVTDTTNHYKVAVPLTGKILVINSMT